MALLRRSLTLTLACALTACFPACRVSDDAGAASQQMSATAEGLEHYYKALDAGLADTTALFELDAAISGIPFDEGSRTQTEALRTEVEKRERIAADLAKLASSFAALSHSKASEDTAAAAARLGQELVAVKALPGGSPVPEALGKAGGFMMQMLQQRDEKKSARAMDEALQTLADLFRREKPTYDSLARTHLRQASQVAQDLIQANGVEASPMLAPALEPFHLTALPPSPALQASLKSLAVARLEKRTSAETHKAEEASDAMLEALDEMSHRVHTLASEKTLSARGNPLSLKQVNEWAGQAATE